MGENRKSFEEIRQVLIDKGIEITDPSSKQITLRFTDGDEITFMAKGGESVPLIMVALVPEKASSAMQ